MNRKVINLKLRSGATIPSEQNLNANPVPFVSLPAVPGTEEVPPDINRAKEDRYSVFYKVGIIGLFVAALIGFFFSLPRLQARFTQEKRQIELVGKPAGDTVTTSIPEELRQGYTEYDTALSYFQYPATVYSTKYRRAEASSIRTPTGSFVSLESARLLGKDTYKNLGGRNLDAETEVIAVYPVSDVKTRVVTKSKLSVREDVASLKDGENSVRPILNPMPVVLSPMQLPRNREIPLSKQQIGGVFYIWSLHEWEKESDNIWRIVKDVTLSESDLTLHAPSDIEGAKLNFSDDTSQVANFQIMYNQAINHSPTWFVQLHNGKTLSESEVTTLMEDARKKRVEISSETRTVYRVIRIKNSDAAFIGHRINLTPDRDKMTSVTGVREEIEIWNGGVVQATFCLSESPAFQILGQ